jgi:hypothetical protein
MCNTRFVTIVNVCDIAVPSLWRYLQIAPSLLQTLRCNVDMLKLIQLGLSFTDGNGNWVNGCTCWQFNFKFSLS